MTWFSNLEERALHALRVLGYLLLAAFGLAIPAVVVVLTKAAPDWYVWLFGMLLVGFAMFKLDKDGLQSFSQWGVEKYKDFRGQR